MKKILLIIIYLSDLVNEAIRDLVKKYKARATARQKTEKVNIQKASDRDQLILRNNGEKP